MRAEVSNHKHAATVAVCNYFAQWSELLNADFEACERHSAELVAFCADKKVEQWRLLAAICHALACATRRPTAENVVAVRAAMSAKNRIGIRMFNSVFLTYLAAALLSAGDVTNAEVTLKEAFAFVEKSGVQFWLAELHRLDGRMALKRPEEDRARAESSFSKRSRSPGGKKRLCSNCAQRRIRQAVARRGFGRRSPRAVGAHPRRDRGRRDDARCPQRARAARRNRLIDSRNQSRRTGFPPVLQTGALCCVGECFSTSRWPIVAASITNQVAEQFPALAIESGELHCSDTDSNARARC